MTNPNKHIEEFLEYYFKLEKSPEYAVLLKGNWGVGKTWFINKTLQTFNENKGKYLYVSLYGINKYEEIEEEFFKQLHPLLSSKSMSLAGKIAKGLLKTTIHIDIDGDKNKDGSVVSQIPDINLPDYLTKTEGFVLVFDDLERCSIGIGNILGYINHFVEHQGYKVIILANEEEILAKDVEDKNNANSYRKIKEKLIGKTFEIEADFNGALQSFIDDISCEKIKEIYNSNIDLIKELYENSNYKNLRHLKQALWDFERFYQYLSEAAQNKKELVVDLMQYYLCYSFEIKSGNILSNDIRSLSMGYAISFANRDKADKEETAYDRIAKKHPNINFFNSLLEESIWADIFDKGFIKKSAIEESLFKSQYFYDENTPTWIKLWHFTKLTDDEFKNYLSTVETEFETMIHDELGVVIHLVGLFLNLSDIQLYKKTKKEILIFSKSYIDSLKNKGFLIKKENRYHDFDRESWGGLGFSGKELNEFKEFCIYLQEKIDDAINESYPDAGKELLQLMKEDVIKFRRRITLCEHEEQLYYEIPILSHIQPEEFVSVFLSISSEHKRSVGIAFKKRYEFSSLNQKIKSELNWLENVRDLLSKEQEKFNGKLSGYYINVFIDYCLNESINTLSELH